MALHSMLFKRITFFIEKNRYLVPLFSFIAVAIAYFFLAHRISSDLTRSSSYNYYPYLIDSFLHGRTDLASPKTYDLSLFNSKWYLYYGPSPILFILPFYIISGVHASDVFFTLLGGYANVILFYFVLVQCKKYFAISLSPLAEIFLILSFGLASPNLFLSLTGGIWFTCQIFATTYLLLFYLFYFKFLQNDKPYCLVLTMVFFCMAILARLSVIFHGVMFLYLFIHMRTRSRKLPLKTLTIVAAVALAFVAFEAFYNYIRFQNPLETGLRFHIGAPRYAEVVGKNILFSLQFASHNIYYYFLHGVDLVLHRHPVGVDPEGNSVFSVYPALLLFPVFLFFKQHLDQKMRLFLIPVGITTLASIAFLMCFFATGWVQFGSRYFLDVLPLLFLVLVFIMRHVPKSVQIALLSYGIFVNYFGILALYGK